MSTVGKSSIKSSFSDRFRDLGRGSHFMYSYKQAHRSAQTNSKGRSHICSNPAGPRSTGTAKPAARRQVRSRVLQRTSVAVNRPLPKKSRLRKMFGLRLNDMLSQRLMTAMAVIVFLFGLGVSVLGLRTNKQVVAQVQNAVNRSIENGDDTVDEQKPSQAEMGAYVVDSIAPRYVRIGKLGVFARVRAQGLDVAGAVSAPGNVHDAGWYRESSKPGEAGAMLLDGHVSGPTIPGVFKDIKNLHVGDTIEVERGDGQRFSYNVVKSETAPVAQTDMTSALLSAEPGRPGLNLITCTGKFDPATGAYEDRIVVYAVQI